MNFKRNPWNIGDVYAYKFHTAKSFRIGLKGKYILLQKTDDVDDNVNEGCGKLSVIQVYNKIFDYLPDIAEFENIPLLTLAPYYANYGEDMLLPEKWYMNAVMEFWKERDYPKKYLNYIGNNTDNLSKTYIHKNGNYESVLDWHNMEDWLIDYYFAEVHRGKNKHN